MFKKIIKFTFFIIFVLYANTAYCLNLNSIKANMLSGDYKAAITEGEKLIAKEPHSEELYYILGLSYLRDGNYLRASDIFEIILNEFKDSRFKEEAKMGLGDTYLLRGDLKSAEATYKELINKNANTKLKAQIYYRLSEVAFKGGDSVKGQEYLTKLKHDSPFSPEAKQGIDSCSIAKSNNSAEFYYSVQVGSFSMPANADNLVKKLNHAGYTAYIEESASSSAKVYRVRVGKVKSRQEAEDLSRKLNQDGYPIKICP